MKASEGAPITVKDDRTRPFERDPLTSSSTIPIDNQQYSDELWRKPKIQDGSPEAAARCAQFGSSEPLRIGVAPAMHATSCPAVAKRAR